VARNLLQVRAKDMPMRPALFISVALAAASAAFLLARRRPRPSGLGSQTNASDAVDDIELGADPSADEVVDASVQETFPASDPAAYDGAGETAYERRQNLSDREKPQAAAPAPRRSPDWLSRN
jgi:hypothetical protein